jgi:RNA polymerase sigma-70 factor (ECF subfamily)
MMSTRTFGQPPDAAPDGRADQELAAAAADGDPGARRKLIERVLERTRRTVAYLVGADREADDMAQIALVQILRSAHTFRGECTLEYWADRITVRTAMRELRRRKRREQVEPEALVLGPPAPSADAQADLRMVRARLALLLGKLTPERRTAVVLHHVQGYGIAEVAEMTGAPVNTVRDRLRVGRRQLRKRILSDRELRGWLETEER